MPDFKRLVSEQLSDLDLPPDAKDQVIAELAGHLEDSEGTQVATEISWRTLKSTIERAKCEGETVNHQTKTVWLPGIAILFPIGLVLLFLDRAFLAQQIIWWTCMAMLLCAARSERNRLNARTRSIWLPGLISLTAASLSLLAAELVLPQYSAYFFTNGLLRSDTVVLRPSLWFYSAWLLTQVLWGGLGAFLSRRAEGTVRARIVAATFPAIVMFALWTLVIPLSALVEHNTFLWSHPQYYLLGVFFLVVPPAIALIAGATPFLQDSKPVTAQG